MDNNDKTTSSGFSFGLKKEVVAAKLQSLADQISAGRIIPQGTVTAINAMGDYELTTLSITYAEPRP